MCGRNRVMTNKLVMNRSVWCPLCTEGVHVVVAEEEQRYDVSSMESIHREDLRKIVHYLRPLVQGIDFFQSDMTTHWDVLPVFNALQSFYRSKTADPQTPNRLCQLRPLHPSQRSSFRRILLENCFSSRMNTQPYSGCSRMRLLELFQERLTCKMSKSSVSRDCSLRRLSDCAVQTVWMNWTNWLTRCRSRHGLPEATQEAARNKPQRVPWQVSGRGGVNRWEVPRTLQSSYAAVERAFSVQGCFLQPRRNQLSLATVKSLMTIKINCMLAEKNGWEDNLLSYLQSSTEILAD